MSNPTKDACGSASTCGREWLAMARASGLGFPWCVFVVVCPLVSQLGCAAAGRSTALHIAAQAQGVSVTSDAGMILRYRDREVPFKPYVEQLYSPAGVNILRDAPHDHLHHHGLMYAVNVDGAEFWGEAAPAGRQVPGERSKLMTQRVGQLDCACFAQHLDWLAPGEDKPRLLEERTIAVFRGRDLDASLMTWQTDLRVPPGRETAELTGRRYSGLGIRFVESMDKDGRFFNADAKTGVADTNNVRSTWVAYTAKADGHLVTVAMFDHPSNPRHPATWFTMNSPFAYITDTPNLHHEKMTLTQTQRLRYRFGVALWDGQPTPQQIESLYRRWTALPTPP